MLTINEPPNRVVIQRPDGNRMEPARATPQAFEAASAARLRWEWDIQYHVYRVATVERSITRLPDDMVRIREAS